MHIDVSLHGVFRIGRFKEKVLSVPSDAAVQYIINELSISDKLLGIILINGVHANRESLLSDGDKLMLLPLLEGG